MPKFSQSTFDFAIFEFSYHMSTIGMRVMDPEFFQELLPYVAKAACGRALGKSWEELAVAMEVPAFPFIRPSEALQRDRP